MYPVLSTTLPYYWETETELFFREHSESDLTPSVRWDSWLKTLGSSFVVRDIIPVYNCYGGSYPLAVSHLPTVSGATSVLWWCDREPKISYWGVKQLSMYMHFYNILDQRCLLYDTKLNLIISCQTFMQYLTNIISFLSPRNWILMIICSCTASYNRGHTANAVYDDIKINWCLKVKTFIQV